MSFNGCKYCLPVFIHSYYISDGHSKKSLNATVTFIKFENNIYAITCLHVIKELDKIRTKLNDYWYTLSLAVGRSMIQLSEIDPSNPNKRRDAFRKIHKSFGDIDVDIVIAPINTIWPFISAKKAKIAIDMDKWIEPEWSNIKMGLAVGYPTEHKYHIRNQVATPCVNVTAELISNLDIYSNQFTMFSSLEIPHKFFFSGLSGGPVFCAENGAPLGIVFEGHPGSSDSFNRNQADVQSFFSENDILIKGLILTPSIFSYWLKQASLI